ncbi:retropepsin-like aspartic protease family protein [Roseivivax sp. CAU 1761]
MPDIPYGQLSYLVLLGAVLVFWMFVQNRQGLGRKLQALLAWGLIFLGLIAAIGLWDGIRRTAMPRQSVISETGAIALPRAPDGHFYATLEVNGAAIPFMVDTGASGTVLTARDAERAGLDPDALAYHAQAMTANGTVRTAPVTLDRVALGPYADTAVPAYVNAAEMGRSLLGMSYLRRFARVSIEGDRMVLAR